MLCPVKVLDIEWSSSLPSLEGLEGYGEIRALVRVHNASIGYAKIPTVDGKCPAADLKKAIFRQNSTAILRHLLSDWLACPPESRRLHPIVSPSLSHPVQEGRLPRVTLAVCTRDRTGYLRDCLEAVEKLNYPQLEILVVDNAPGNDATEKLVRMNYPEIRYLLEPRPGLNWARNRAVVEATGEIIAYTDDDAVVDPEWINALVAPFVEDPSVMAVTGLVVPYELETEAQLYFEQQGGGFGRGFERRWYRTDLETGDPCTYYGAGQFGTGANMAYRRSLFDQIGGFDPALDVGTATQGGGDLDMFYRVLKEGHTFVYEPNAVVRHRHRRAYSQLKAQLSSNGIGLYSYFVREASAYPDERMAFIRFGLWWLKWNLRRLFSSLWRPSGFASDLIIAELWGCLLGVMGRYGKARRESQRILDAWGSLPLPARSRVSIPQARVGSSRNSVAVRTVDLSGDLRGLGDVTEYAQTRVFVLWDGKPVGQVDIANHHRPIGATRLRGAISDQLLFRLLEEALDLKSETLDAEAVLTLARDPADANGPMVSRSPRRLSERVSVSVVVATYDRPEQLRACLESLTAQKVCREVEIIVVDNHPVSGVAAGVVDEFKNVVLVHEPRRGLAYARNRGFSASKGEILVTTDDDVTMPPDWLEKIVSAFAYSGVMAVTGAILPAELETEAQQLFEEYGGLGRGFESVRADRDWFGSFRRSAVPTWRLGATANAAFRKTIFSNPKIGLMDEALGPGMPSGVGEDTYLFYKILKAGYTITYEPTAYVWHRHCRDMPGLRRKIYDYSKGHVAYHLTTLLRDRDLRALVYLAAALPRWRLQQIKNWLLGRRRYPLSLILLEIAGNLAGPLALWWSRARVRKEGRSQPFPLARLSSPREEEGVP